MMDELFGKEAMDQMRAGKSIDQPSVHIMNPLIFVVPSTLSKSIHGLPMNSAPGQLFAVCASLCDVRALLVRAIGCKH